MKALQTGPSKTWSTAKWLGVYTSQNYLIPTQNAREYSTRSFNNNACSKRPSNCWIFKQTLIPQFKSFSTTTKTRDQVPEKPDMDDRYRDGGYKPTKEKFEEYKGKSILDPEVAHKYCYDIVRKHDFYTHSVGKHFPVSRQKYFYAIHAFFLEILKSREASRQMMVCKTRLLWWSETLNDIENNKKIQEPIGIALSEVYKNTNANFDLLHRMISYQLFDLERSDMQSMNDLTNYAENTRSLTFYLFLHILGINDKNAYKAASHMGRCMGIIDVLKKMQYFLINHRSYLPSDILLKHNLFFDRIYNPRVEGLVADQFYDVVLEIAAHAKKHLEVSRTFKDKLPKHAHRALLFGVEAESYLTELEDYNFDIFDDHFRRISYIKMPYRILKASKKESY